MKKPRVIVDGFVFENNFQIGIWRVFFEVINRLSDQIDFTIWLQAPPQMPLPQRVKYIRDNSRWLGSWNKFGRRLMAECSRRLGPSSLLRNADIFHSTYYTLSPFKSLTTIATIHDLIPELECWENILPVKKQSIDDAFHCVCVSQTVGNEIRKFYPSTAKKLSVIPHGHQHIQQSGMKAYFLKKGILFVGNRLGYKNFLFVIKALADPSWPSELSIRVAGNPLSDNEWNIIDYYGVRDKIIELGRVDDLQLAEEYAGSVCFIFPSRLEGFGIPILEAQLNGCPVVCSDIPVFREVAGDAGIYFDPGSICQFIQSIRAASTESYHKHYQSVVQANLRRFCWNKASLMYLDIYHQALGCTVK